MSTVVCQYNKKNPESEKILSFSDSRFIYMALFCSDPASNHILYTPVYSDLPHIAVNICPQDCLEPL